jgi:hypothetical protein
VRYCGRGKEKRGTRKKDIVAEVKKREKQEGEILWQR